MKLQINLPFSMWNYRLSGVYKITFEDGTFYIGCSEHLRSRANRWNNFIESMGSGCIAGKDMGTMVLDKIREGMNATLDIIELCHQSDLKDKEAFYLDKYKDDNRMLSSELNGAWVSILQYKLDGLFIKKHFSISGAARYSNTRMSAIQKVLLGERRSHKGMVYVFEHDYHKRRKGIVRSRYKAAERKNGRDVLVLNSDRIEVGRFKTIIAAAKYANTKPQSAARVLNKVQKTAAGYIFKYA